MYLAGALPVARKQREAQGRRAGVQVGQARDRVAVSASGGSERKGREAILGSGSLGSQLAPLGVLLHVCF